MNQANHAKAPAEASGVVQREDRASKAAQIVFVALCAVVLLIPSIGMFWAPTSETTENRKLAEMPTLAKDGRPNVDFMGELGAYFEDHFACRNELVTLNAKLRTALGTSPTDSVVVGGDGWLFYGGTLHDYTGEGRLTDRKMGDLVFNLSLIQGYCEANGARFALAIVPNKNSIYPEKMPFYYGAAAGGSVLDDLSVSLNDKGVNNVDLYSLLADAKAGSPDDLLYYKIDTHWNQRGALLASERILDVLDRPEAAQELAGIAESVDAESHQGDLSAMLYPANPQSEQAPAFSNGLNYQIVEGANEIDTEASAWIETKGEGDGVLYVFRDSFAQNLVPFLSSSFERSYFDWCVPFDYTKVQGRGITDVVVEKAERSLGDLAKNPGIIPAPSLAIPDEELASIEDVPDFGEKRPAIRTDGSFSVIEGILPEAVLDEGFDELYVRVAGEGGGMCYVPFRVSTDGDDYGYRAYVYQDDLAEAERVELLVEHGGRIERLVKADIK